jgi:hypothetical protein
MKPGSKYETRRATIAASKTIMQGCTTYASPLVIELSSTATPNTFYVAIETARIEDQTFGEAESRTNEVPASIAICRPHRDEPLIHRVCIVGEQPFRAYVAEWC